MSTDSDSDADGRTPGCVIVGVGIIYSVSLIGLFGTAYFFITARLLQKQAEFGQVSSWAVAAALLLAWGGVVAYAGARNARSRVREDWLDRLMAFAMGFAIFPLVPVLIGGGAMGIYFATALALMQLGRPPDQQMFVLAGILSVGVAIFLWLATKNEVLDKATTYGPKVGLGLCVFGVLLGYGFDFKVYYILIAGSIALWAATMLLIRSFPAPDLMHPAASRAYRLFAGLLVATASAVLVAGLLGHLGFEIYKNISGRK